MPLVEAMAPETCRVSAFWATETLPEKLIAALGVEAGFEVSRRYAATSSTGSWRLSARAADGLREAVRTVAHAQALVVDGCGCAHHCHLDVAERRAYVAVQGPELFAGVP